jgi:hypothetical protein
MKRDTSQRPFLAYANYSLKGNPKNLHKIFDSIEQYYTLPEPTRAYIRRVVDIIVDLSSYNDPGVITEYSPPPVINNADLSKGDELAKVLQTLDNIVPNWKAINEDPSFLGWLDEVDPLNGVTRRRLFNDAFANYDAARIANFFMRHPEKDGVQASGGSSKDSLSDEGEIQRVPAIILEEPPSSPGKEIILPEEAPGPCREVSSYDESIIPIAVEAVYGYRDGFCESK